MEMRKFHMKIFALVMACKDDWRIPYGADDFVIRMCNALFSSCFHRENVVRLYVRVCLYFEKMLSELLTLHGDENISLFATQEVRIVPKRFRQTSRLNTFTS